MNVYDVNHVSGDVYEVEANFFERDGDDWVFFAGMDEVLRVPWADVVSVSKSTLPPAIPPVETPDSVSTR